MKRFNQWLRAFPKHLCAAFAALDKMSLVVVRQHDTPTGGNGVAIHGTTMEEVARHRPPEWPMDEWMQFLGIFAKHGHARKKPEEILAAWAMCGLWSQGIRAYCPTPEEFTALSQVEIRVSWQEYRQPFETFVVAVPDGVMGGRVSSDIGAPVACICRHNPSRRVAAFSIQSTRDGTLAGDTYGCHWWQESYTGSIEEYLADCPDGDLAAAEASTCETVKRVAINANLLLTQYGARRIGASEPAREAELTRALREGNRAERRAAERELKSLPVVYGIEQNVKVYETEGFHGVPGAGGWHVKPHWRRGHWAKVACGKGHAERRRVFRPAVMVNAERFAGEHRDTRAVYTTGGAA